MSWIVFAGLGLVALGMGGIGWCGFQALKIRHGGLPPEETKKALRRIIPMNMGSVFVAFIGLAVMLVGMIL